MTTAVLKPYDLDIVHNSHLYLGQHDKFQYVITQFFIFCQSANLMISKIPSSMAIS